MAVPTVICRASDVRTLTDLTTDDVDDNKLDEIIQYAWQQVQNDIGTRIENEDVEWIDSYRKNTIDGSNTSFYVKNSFTAYVGDLDGDQDVDSSDVEVWLYNESTQTRSAGTVSTVQNYGLFTMTTAPSGDNEMTVTYISLPLPTTHHLIKKATIELAAALCYSKISSRGIQNIRLGRLAVDKSMSAGGFDKFYRQYQRTLDQINAKATMLKHVDKVRVPTMDYPEEYVANLEADE